MTEDKIKSISDMTRKEIEDCPRREWNEDIGEFDSMVILPLMKLHDSGYRCMDFVAIKDGKPFKRLSGCSDVIHINGIGGYGKYKGGGIPSMTEPINWSIDCLKKSGLLQIFTHGKLTCDSALSSFSIYSKEK